MEANDWQQRLDAIYEMMREMSLQTDPQAMVRAYGRRVGRMYPVDRRISLSRRDLEWPRFRITRFSGWKEEVNPWRDRDRLPLLSGGILAEMLYSDRPHLIDHLEVDPADPAAPYLEGQQSLQAIPMLDGGQALNMVVATRREPAAFDRERFPDQVWLANLFGRATHNLVLKAQVQEAYDLVDREMKVVADIQHSLLPRRTPPIEGLELATYYQTSQRAGGDYYDFFPLPRKKWGLLIADVSGHGTPAAVIMAITHSIAHLFPADRDQPGELLTFVNRHLTDRYTAEGQAFVTAFYGVYDPAARTLRYSSAGHNPPRLWKCSRQESLALDGARKFPLGVTPDTAYDDDEIQLDYGDRLLLYTDGVTEAEDSEGRLFGPKRVDDILRRSCRDTPQAIIDHLMEAVESFTGGAAPTDDRTLVAARLV